jgi:3-hydroxyisobutyrate dehydrogenase
MAANCSAAGHDLTVWNRSQGPIDWLSSRHAIKAAPSVSDLSKNCTVVVTMLSNDAAARAVYLGADGLIRTPGASVLVEMGTMSPALVGELRATARDHGKSFVDAPVSGATQAARDAHLLIMAGAREGEWPQLETVFAAMARKTVWLGEAGSGAVMKLSVNLLIHGLNQTLAEALTLASKSGIDDEIAYDVIENSAAAAPMLKYRRPIYLDERAHDVTFTVDLAEKDVGLALELADQIGVSMPQTKTTLAVLEDAISSGYGDRDMASIVNYIKDRSR